MEGWIHVHQSIEIFRMLANQRPERDVNQIVPLSHFQTNKRPQHASSTNRDQVYARSAEGIDYIYGERRGKIHRNPSRHLPYV